MASAQPFMRLNDGAPVTEENDLAHPQTQESALPHHTRESGDLSDALAPVNATEAPFSDLLNATMAVSAEPSVATAQLLERPTELPYPEHQRVNTTSKERQRWRWLKWEWE